MSSKDQKNFELYNLEEDTLNYVLSLSDEQKTGYFHSIISKYYSDSLLSPEIYKELQAAYRSSFMLEKVIRNNKILRSGFRPIYTKTGLIRDLTNNIYFIDSTTNIH